MRRCWMLGLRGSMISLLDFVPCSGVLQLLLLRQIVLLSQTSRPGTGLRACSNRIVGKTSTTANSCWHFANSRYRTGPSRSFLNRAQL